MPNTEADRFIHVVAGLIRHPQNPQKFFFTQRQKGKHLESLWEFPGGKLEPSESRFHALQRELQEEVGIQVSSAEPFQSLNYRYKEKNIHLDVWEIKRYFGVPHGKEGQKARWVAINEIKNYEFPEADLPVLSALQLPRKILITPDIPEQHEDSFLEHFENLIRCHDYPLVLFRSHHLKIPRYRDIANEMASVCTKGREQLIIHRPDLKSLQSKQFNDFPRRHLSSYVLTSMQSNPFASEINLSASCHDRDELIKAQQLKCEFAFLSTLRETLSHPGRKAKGWNGFKQIVAHIQLPVYALGGVRRKDFSVARFQGGVGVAGTGDFWTI